MTERIIGYDDIEPKIEMKLKDVPDERILMTKISPLLVKAAQAKWGNEQEKMTDILSDSTLWWIDLEMTNLIDTAAKSFPRHTLQQEDLSNDLFGVCFFERPLLGTNVENPERPVCIHAMSWSPGYLEVAGRKPCLWIMSWFRQEDGTWLANAGHKWFPQGTASWALGYSQDEMFVPQEDLVMQSNVEDCSRLMTIFMLASQKGISKPVLQKMDRPALRRTQRENCNISPIKIINLRKPENHHSSDTDGQEMKWSHRWIVDGHWRQQPYGQGRSQTRPVWIAPYIKGPEDKPLVMKESVKIMRETA